MTLGAWVPSQQLIDDSRTFARLCQTLAEQLGIRFADAKTDDQVRITTPEKARAIGSDYIVVGRPITQAADPIAAYQRCLQEFSG